MNTKRLLPAVLAAIILPLSAMADTETVNGIEWTYTVSDGKVSVGDEFHGYYSDYHIINAISTSTSGAITIPSTLGGYPVTSINYSAFEGCSGLTSVTIPGSVTSIGYKAFYGCSSLRSVTIGNGVTRIDDSAFDGCNSALYDTTSIPGVKLVDGWAVGHESSLSGNLDLTGCRGIGPSAFWDCSGLTSVTIGNGVTSIGNRAFYGCSSLRSVTIPASVTSISYYNSPFEGCGGIRSAVVPGCFLLSSIFPEAYQSITSVAVANGSTSIKDSAFKDCSSLTSVTIPTSVTSIGASAFSGCSGLTSVKIDNGVRSIGDEAFYNCQSLRSLKIPNSVESIGSGVFSGCDSRIFDTASLPGVKLVDGWCVGWYTGLSGAVNLKGSRGIAGEAFADNREITSVSIPGTVKSIGASAFYDCYNLTSVTIPNSVTRIGASAFYDCYNLTSVTIGNGVTSIGDWAFECCGHLKSVTIGNSVTSIGSGVFYSCYDLTSVVLPSSVRSISDNAFSGSYLEKIYIHRDFPGNIANDLWGAPSHCLAIFYTRIFVFDQQGGTGGQSHVPVSSATTPASITRPKRTGYVFTGYWTGPKGTGTKIYGANGKKVRSWAGGVSAVLYAGWTKSKFYIVFKANGGKGKMAKQTVTYGKAAKLKANKFTRKGWVFRGWAKSKSGAVVYKNKASIKGLASETNVALNAKWAKKTYRVAFYANGGKGKMAVEKFTYGKAKKLTANKFTRKGYSFKGWAKSKALATQGKVAYKNKKAVKNLVTTGKTVKLYAVWKKK